jgi:phospholipid/cholesterol/gamma-HCH transport system substrate-binding protein
MKRAMLVCAVAAATVGVTGCQPYTGINSLPLPGTVGTGPDSYTIKVQLRNADNLVANTPVYVNDINVGTTTLVALENGWTPTLTLSIKDDVKLPANATAALAQTSLLGSKHVDLLVPENPQGQLQPGALIKEDRVKQFPQTEDLLAGVSTLLNGGGLQHFQTITTELNRALGKGRSNDAKELLTQLSTFTDGLDKQSGDIVYALQKFDKLGTTLEPRLAEIDKAITQLPKGLDTVNELEPRLLKTLDQLGSAVDDVRPFSDSDGGVEELRAVLADLKRPFKYTGDIQMGSIPRALRIVPFVLFPVDNIPYLVRGDYAHVNLGVDLTLESLDKNLFTGINPLSGTLYQAAQAARKGGAPAPQLPAVPGVPNPLPFPGNLGLKAPVKDQAPAATPGNKSPLDSLPKPALPKIGN